MSEAVVEYANFERRQSAFRSPYGLSGPGKAVSMVYEKALRTIETQLSQLQGEDKTQDEQRTNFRREFAFLSLHHARFQAQVMQNLGLARSIFDRATHIASDDSVLWLAYIDFETSQAGPHAETIVPSLYDRALAALSKPKFKAIKKALWEQYVDFMRDRASNVFALRTIKEKAKKGLAILSDSRKRKRDDESEATPVAPAPPLTAAAPVTLVSASSSSQDDDKSKKSETETDEQKAQAAAYQQQMVEWQKQWQAMGWQYAAGGGASWPQNYAYPYPASS
jgi:hypothetical protein